MNRASSAVLVRWMIDREIDVCALLNRASRPPMIKKFFVVISWLGDGKGWYVLMLALPLLYGDNGVTTSWIMVKVALVNLALYKVIKGVTGRSRPCMVNADITLGTAPLDQYSFPSGHTMHAVAFSIIIAAHHSELTGVVMVFSSLIAFSRIILGLHYPTDVIAGGLIGGYVASFWLTS
ncbi:MAG TPA: phosphatase PAP2 family protein [Terriglobales bacterium]|nr:phosphatase PAP2 family protein [Terriglobales bacterium]